jgi:hypothetical protein
MARKGYRTVSVAYKPVDSKTFALEVNKNNNNNRNKDVL